MTENEVKAIRWMKCVKDDAVVTLDHIAKNEPNVRPTLYAGRKEKAETIINGFDELEQYRAIGTVEECREAMERQRAKKPDETREKIVELMGDLPRVELFARQRVPGWEAWGNEVESSVVLEPEGDGRKRNGEAE